MRAYNLTPMRRSAGDDHEAPIAQQQRFPPGTILVFDKAYIALTWFTALTAAGVYFVTRLKRNTIYTVIEERTPPRHRGHCGRPNHPLLGTGSRTKAPGHLRRVVLALDDGEQLEFLTNHLTLGASTVAAIYKERWQIELFFKALKQHLRVKTFVGTSANALRIQIWTALIGLLLLKDLQLKARFGWSLSNLVALLRMNLFVYGDLWTWLNDPFTPPPLRVDASVQQPLPLS